MNFIKHYQEFFSKCILLDGITALLIRIYLGPVFIMAGYNKLNLSDPNISGISQIFASDEIVQWFGNTQWGLGLPFPEFLANLAAWTEFLGGWLLLLGVLTRLISLPLMITMLVAAITVHADNGWFAITPTNSATSVANVPTWLGFDSGKESLANSELAGVKLERMRDILAENGNVDWLYQQGNIVILNNGIEFATTYFILLLALLLIGPGRFTSIDHYLYTYWIKPKLSPSVIT
ncbi:HvfX family Cu-binding RiPP maturation protein [Thalassotalea profundi]|uniref:DoxD-like inner membrane protein n=1 Tax=Thalassotalea profundi TaxID=2036687 RepID=A0ABQ3IFJ1_9GAMM|nr:DoxX family protein [Thalassotalea profundi]GHE82685.1 DoxD-like inner membrane protein [Thalassotalea profundi]